VLSFVLSDVSTGSFTLNVAISVATVKRSIAENFMFQSGSFKWVFQLDMPTVQWHIHAKVGPQSEQFGTRNRIGYHSGQRDRK